MPAAATTVLVTGDVTMDWNLAHRPTGTGSPAGWTADDSARMSWQRGGAALLADLIAAVSHRLARGEPSGIAVRQADVPHEMVRPDDGRFHHSYARWSQFDGVWRVDEFLGLDRARRRPSEWMSSPPANWISACCARLPYQQFELLDREQQFSGVGAANERNHQLQAQKSRDCGLFRHVSQQTLRGVDADVRFGHSVMFPTEPITPAEPTHGS